MQPNDYFPIKPAHSISLQIYICSVLSYFFCVLPAFQWKPNVWQSLTWFKHLWGQWVHSLNSKWGDTRKSIIPASIAGTKKVDSQSMLLLLCRARHIKLSKDPCCKWTVCSDVLPRSGVIFSRCSFAFWLRARSELYFEYVHKSFLKAFILSFTGFIQSLTLFVFSLRVGVGQCYGYWSLSGWNISVKLTRLSLLLSSILSSMCTY